MNYEFEIVCEVMNMNFRLPDKNTIGDILTISNAKKIKLLQII